MGKALSLIIVGSLFLLNCGSPTKDDQAGNSSQAGNAFSARILYQDGSPAAGATVRICPVNYVPSMQKLAMSAIKTTDTNGYYYYGDLDTGSYNVDAEKDSLGVFVDSIVVSADTGKCNVPNGILKKLGMITGIIHMPGQNDTNQVRVTLYIPGTRRITKPAIGGRFAFDLVPAGRYQVIIDPTLSEYNVRIIDTSLSSGQVLDLDTVWIAKYDPDTIDIVTEPAWGVWGPNKVYRLHTNLWVNPGDSLVILPGTKIECVSSFNVWGTLIAEGDSDNVITISGSQETKNWTWAGVRAGTKETFRMRYCVIENGEVGLWVSLLDSTKVQSFNVMNCVIRYGLVGIGFMDMRGPMDTLRVLNNVFHDLDMAVRFNCDNDLFPETYLLRNNIFMNNKTNVLNITSRPTYLIHQNCFYGFTDFSGLANCGLPVLIVSPDSSNILLDPMFADTAFHAENYHLMPNSPCRGTGYGGTDMGLYGSPEGN